MATRYKYQGKYQTIDKSEALKDAPMVKALVERVLSRRRIDPNREIIIDEWDGDRIYIIIDGEEFIINADIEFSSEVVTDVSWTFFKMVSDEDGEHGQVICDGYYKFWNADYENK